MQERRHTGRVCPEGQRYTLEDKIFVGAKGGSLDFVLLEGNVSEMAILVMPGRERYESEAELVRVMAR